jgi:hypothetical protein
MGRQATQPTKVSGGAGGDDSLLDAHPPGAGLALAMQLSLGGFR